MLRWPKMSEVVSKYTMNRLLRPMKNCPRNDDPGGVVRQQQGLLVDEGSLEV